MIHVGILLCDEHVPEAVEQFGTYDTDFKRMLSADESEQWRYSVWRCYEGEFPLSTTECSAWIISGSRQGVYDENSWIHKLKIFINDLDQAEAKLIGVCFGHQIIHEALGGKVTLSGKGWGVGAYPVRLYEPLGSIAPGQEIKVLAVHKDQVQKMAPDFILIGGCPFTPFAITRKGEHIMTFQAHPEFEDDFYQGVCERLAEELDEATLQRLKVKQGVPDERELVRHEIREFLK